MKTLEFTYGDEEKKFVEVASKNNYELSFEVAHQIIEKYSEDMEAIRMMLPEDENEIMNLIFSYTVQKGITGQTTNPSGGNSVLLEHANGSRTLYCHLDNGSNNHISVGQIVEVGQKLGTDVIKTTGNSTGLHLHFAIYVNGEYVDPTAYLQGIKALKPYGYVEPTPTPNTGEITHVVVAGDTLWAIAKKYLGDGNKYPEIARYNNIANPNVIFNGQKIRIPNGNPQTTTKYVVKKGDTLSGIAARYGTTWQKLYEKNKNVIGSNPNLIIPGQKLII